MPKVGDCLLIKPGVSIGMDMQTLMELEELKIKHTILEPGCTECERKNKTCVVVMFTLPAGHQMWGSKWCAHEKFFELILQDEDTKLSTLDLSPPGEKSKEDVIVYDGKAYRKEEKRETDKRLEDIIL